ncbi:T6SS effector amidase Tae4 family protein [Massilia sp. GER05]|uniref:T6SS effector amidase Tae4 family protein n=1 Tax=Massilia sp. GER05 TaxID=3394605 RepID=UPI003F86A7F1
MAISAHAGNQSAQIQVRRPAWADMQRHYPSKAISTPTLYDQMIGGRFKKLYEQPAYTNTCAVRMSYALNRSGLKLAKHPDEGASVEGGDGYTYWIRVANLKAYLIDRFKGADEELHLPAIPSSLLDDNAAMSKQFKERVRQAEAWLTSKLSGRNGIVVFDVSGWRDASGHFTLWDGTTTTLAYADPHDDPTNNLYYFWLTELRESKSIVQTTKVRFWELK